MSVPEPPEPSDQELHFTQQHWAGQIIGVLREAAAAAEAVGVPLYLTKTRHFVH